MLVKLSIKIFLPTSRMTKREPILSLRHWKFTVEKHELKFVVSKESVIKL